MRMRRWVMAGLIALALSLAAPAAEYTIDETVTAFPWPAGVYPTLQDLQDANVLRPGDRIILNNDDESLIAPLDWDSITIRSAGNNRFYVGAAGSSIIRNTQMLNMDSIIIDSPLDIIFDSRAPVISRWDGGLVMYDAGGDVNTNISIAPDRYFFLNSLDGLHADVNITGGGTLVVRDGGSAANLSINQGRVHFAESALWEGGDLHVGSGSVFKPSIGNFGGVFYDSSTFLLDSFTADAGARLEIGGVSAIPDYLNIFPGAMVLIDGANPDDSNFADILHINNRLMHAHFAEQGNTGIYDLVLTGINNLSTLDGVGSYADAYRLSNLSYLERDMLDSIYARGGTGADKGFLQTLGGVVIENSLLAVRQHNANLAGQIHRRLTSYQDEELANIPATLDKLGVDHDGEEDGDPLNYFGYGESWAFLDHGRSTQDDNGSDAAYRMHTTTLAVGHDWHNDQWIYGGMIAYAAGAMKLENLAATRNDYDFLSAAAYASWAQDGWYLSGVGTATYGWNDAHSAYNLPGLHLASDADFATSALGIALEAGHMLETEIYGVPLRITPYGGLAYTRMSRDSVDDTGARNAALGVDLRKHFRAADWDTWDMALGLRLAVPMEVEGMTIVPAVDVSYSRFTGNASPEGGTVHMYSNPSASWDVDLMDSNRSALRMAAGVEAQIRDNVSLAAAYEFEWRRQYWNNRFNINVSVDF